MSLLHCINKWSLERPLPPVSSAVTLYAISTSWCNQLHYFFFFFQNSCFTLSWLPAISQGNLFCIKTEFCPSTVCPEVPKLADFALSVRAVCSSTSTWSFPWFAAPPLKHWNGSTCLQAVTLLTLQLSQFGKWLFFFFLFFFKAVVLSSLGSFNQQGNIEMQNFWLLGVQLQIRKINQVVL